jgi:CsoR family transcriptional regulator, copper-sensing transcriptional repressor
MNIEIKTQLLNRLKTVEGQVRGLQRMVDGEQYCIDILRQVTAAQRALDKVNAVLLENHLETCVTTAIRSDQQSERERVIRELVVLFTEPSVNQTFQHTSVEPAPISPVRCEPPCLPNG